MKPAPFAYHAPGSVDEVLELLAEHGPEAKLLAGGQSLVPTMNFRLAQPTVLVDLNRACRICVSRGATPKTPRRPSRMTGPGIGLRRFATVRPPAAGARAGRSASGP